MWMCPPPRADHSSTLWQNWAGKTSTFPVLLSWLVAFFLILLSSWYAYLFWECHYLQGETLWRRMAVSGYGLRLFCWLPCICCTPLWRACWWCHHSPPWPPHSSVPVTSVPSAADCSSLMASQRGLHGARRDSMNFCNIIHFKYDFVSLAGRVVPFLFYLLFVFPSLYAEIGILFSLQSQPNRKKLNAYAPWIHWRWIKFFPYMSRK